MNVLYDNHSSLASMEALTHHQQHLHRITAYKIQKGHQGAPNRLMGLERSLTINHRLLGGLNIFCQIIFLIQVTLCLFSPLKG